MRRTILFSSLIMLLFSIVNFAQEDTITNRKMDPKAAEYFTKAGELAKNSNYDEAIKYYDSSLTVEKDYRTYWLQGAAYSYNGDIEKAISLYKESIKLNPNFDKTYSSLVKAYLRAGKTTEATETINMVKNDTLKTVLKELLQSNLEGQVTDYINKGNELSKTGNYADALAQYDKAIAINNSDLAHYQKGIAYSRMKNNSEALNEFKLALQKNPNFDLAYYGMAILNVEDKKIDEAINNYEKALSLAKDGNTQTIKAGLVNLYLSQGAGAINAKKYDVAISFLTKANTTGESDISHFYLGRAYVESKKYADGLAELDKAEQMKKSVPDGALAYFKGLAYVGLKDKAKAKEQFNKASQDEKYKKNAQIELSKLK